jgi:hypothetical protein
MELHSLPVHSCKSDGKKKALGVAAPGAFVFLLFKKISKIFCWKSEPVGKGPIGPVRAAHCPRDERRPKNSVGKPLAVYPQFCRPITGRIYMDFLRSRTLQV